MKNVLTFSSCLFLFIQTISSHAAGYADAVMADGPIVYYRFSDGVTSPVLDVMNNSGSAGAAGSGFYNAATHPVPGALSGSADTAARFTAAQNGSVAYTSGLNSAGAFTVEAWLRPATNFTDATLTCPVSSVNVTSPRNGWLIYQSSGGFNFRTYNQNTTATAVSITGGGALTVGAWYHVVAVWDGSVGQLYVNGTLTASSPPTNFFPNVSTPFTIGTRSDAAFPWIGDADEVAYYTTALTPAQITAHYQSGINNGSAYNGLVLADAPVGYWRLNEAAYVTPTAANSGSLAAAGNANYYGGAIDGAEAPRPPAFFGFESGNTALQLDGVNDFVGSLSSLLNGKPRFTLTGWIRRNGTQAARTGLFGQNDIVEFGYINNSTLECWTDNGLDIPNAIPDAQWAHIALVSEGSPGKMSMYTNGLLAGSRTSTLPGDNAFKFNIGGGGIFDATGNYFNGQIDEVAIFDKALTADQIQAQYFSTVAAGPQIVQQPQGTNIFEGGDAILTVKVIGSPVLHYQWLNFGEIIPDATNATLVLSNVTFNDSSTYWVDITNAFGSVESSPVDVVVLETTPPVITADPVSVTRYAGGSATLTVAATGGSRLQYAWLHGSSFIPLATNSSLTLNNLGAADQGNYQAVVSNPAGSTTSLVAVVTVIVPTAGSYEQSVVAAGPMAFWRFNEESGTIAYDYVGGHNGTYMNTATTGTEAPKPPLLPGFEAGNRAAQFDGVAGFVQGPSGLMNNAAKFSMVGWVRRGANQADRTGLFGQNDLIEFGFINNNTLEVWTDNGLDISPNPFPNGEWDMVAVVADGSPGTIRMYTNASLAGLRDHVLPTANSFNFNIGGGGIFDGSGNYFNGQIDELALYNKALSAETLCEMYLRATGKPVSISISPQGNIVSDSKPSGTPHNGTDYGASWVASSTDAFSTTRNGLMQFVAAENDQIVLPANTDFNSAQGAITFWMRSAGTAGGGNDGGMLVDRRSSRGDVIVQMDDGSIFVQANDGAGTVNQFSTGQVGDDLWHHVAYVYDQAGNTTIYIDGILSHAQATSRPWTWDPAQQI
ncbi:MAG TPA: LamG-like jellyroll fold domain-containing protein, partial [Candidatus Saccharimonadales bacterium]|nr:LamG-like jellyroll fold domain-containing protein [Candidatus Saccharimonadales bacterium]